MSIFTPSPSSGAAVQEGWDEVLHPRAARGPGGGRFTPKAGLANVLSRNWGVEGESRGNTWHISKVSHEARTPADKRHLLAGMKRSADIHGATIRITDPGVVGDHEWDLSGFERQVGRDGSVAWVRNPTAIPGGRRPTVLSRTTGRFTERTTLSELYDRLLEAYDEAKHQRGMKGSATGGQFVAKNGGAPAASAPKADFSWALNRQGKDSAGGKGKVTGPVEPVTKATSLGKNDSGDQVSALQHLLTAFGFSVVNDQDGQFGRDTEAAVRQLQHKLGLQETGHADVGLQRRLADAALLMDATRSTEAAWAALQAGPESWADITRDGALGIFRAVERFNPHQLRGHDVGLHGIFSGRWASRGETDNPVPDAAQHMGRMKPRHLPPPKPKTRARKVAGPSVSEHVAALSSLQSPKQRQDYLAAHPQISAIELRTVAKAVGVSPQGAKGTLKLNIIDGPSPAPAAPARPRKLATRQLDGMSPESIAAAAVDGKVTRRTAAKRIRVLAEHEDAGRAGFLRGLADDLESVPDRGAQSGDARKGVPRTKFDREGAVAALSAATSRAEADAALEGATVAELQAVADRLDVNWRGASKATLRRRLVDATAGAREDKAAILGAPGGSRFGVPNPDGLDSTGTPDPSRAQDLAAGPVAVANAATARLPEFGDLTVVRDPGWSGAEMDALQRELRQYGGAGYLTVNPWLTGETERFEGAAEAERMRPAVEAQIARLDRVLDVSPLERDVEVWRGMRSGRGTFGGALAGDLTGFRWHQASYGSTSATEEHAFAFAGGSDAPGVMMRIRVPSGTGAIYIEGAADELLLQRGLDFRVLADHGVADHPGQLAGLRRLDVEILPAANPDGLDGMDESALRKYAPQWEINPAGKSADQLRRDLRGVGAASPAVMRERAAASASSIATPGPVQPGDPDYDTARMDGARHGGIHSRQVNVLPGDEKPGSRVSQAKDRIRAIYDAHRDPQFPDDTWVGLGEIRRDLGSEFTTGEVDKALLLLNRDKDVRIAPEANQKMLTQRDWDASVIIGNDHRHTMHIDSSRRADGGVPKDSPDYDTPKGYGYLARPVTRHGRVSTPTRADEAPGSRVSQAQDRIRAIYASRTPGTAVPRPADAPPRLQDFVVGDRPEWMGLADLRDQMRGEYSDEEIDKALILLNRQPDVRVTPESNQGALSQRDEDAAVIIGNQSKFAISITPQRDEPAPSSPSVRPEPPASPALASPRKTPGKAVPRKAGIAPAPEPAGTVRAEGYDVRVVADGKGGYVGQRRDDYASPWEDAPGMGTGSTPKDITSRFPRGQWRSVAAPKADRPAAVPGKKAVPRKASPSVSKTSQASPAVAKMARGAAAKRKALTAAGAADIAEELDAHNYTQAQQIVDHLAEITTLTDLRRLAKEFRIADPTRRPAPRFAGERGYTPKQAAVTMSPDEFRRYLAEQIVADRRRQTWR